MVCSIPLAKSDVGLPAAAAPNTPCAGTLGKVVLCRAG